MKISLTGLQKMQTQKIKYDAQKKIVLIVTYDRRKKKVNPFFFFFLLSNRRSVDLGSTPSSGVGVGASNDTPLFSTGDSGNLDEKETLSLAAPFLRRYLIDLPFN